MKWLARAGRHAIGRRSLVVTAGVAMAMAGGAVPAATAAAASPGGTVQAAPGGYVPTPAAATAEVDTHSLTPYVPLTTQVQQNNTWGISLGGVPTVMATGTGPGYQVVVVQRQWQSPATAPYAYNPAAPANPNPYVVLPQVANLFYPVATASDIVAMQSALTNVATFGGVSRCLYGCYVIVSSAGGMGYTSCPNLDSTVANCGFASAQPGAMFAQFGGTPSASYAPASTAYSLVTAMSTSNGVVTYPGTGGGTESLGCTLSGTGTGTSQCQPRSTNGAVTGSFVDFISPASTTSLVKFTPTSPTSVTARSVDPNTGVNTVTVGANQYQSDPTIASLTSPGFQAVALDRSTLSLLYNGTFSSHTGQSSFQLGSLGTFLTLGPYAGENTLWILASIGDVENTDSGMYGLGQGVAAIGGSFSVVNQLGATPLSTSTASGCATSTLSEYALIGWQQPAQAVTGIAPGAGLETSGAVLCETSPAIAAALGANVTQQAVLQPDARSFFSSPSSSLNAGTSNLQQAVLQGPGTSWPPVAGSSAGTAPTAGQASAYNYLSNLMESATTGLFSCGNTAPTQLPACDGDIRDHYLLTLDTSVGLDNGVATTWNNALTGVPPSYPPNSYFTATDFSGVLAELVTETNALEVLTTYQTTILTAMGNASAASALSGNNAYTFIKKELSPSGDTAVVADVASIFGTVVGDLLPLDFLGGDELADLAAGLDVAAQSLNFGLTLTENASGGPGAQLNDTWDNLLDDLGTTFTGAQNGFQTAMRLAVTDSTRLTATAYSVTAFNALQVENSGTTTIDDLTDTLSSGFTATVYQALLGSVFGSVTLRALWGDKHPNVTTVAYPGTAQSPGGSVHRAVCYGGGACPAEKAGYGLADDGVYFFSLANQPQPAAGDGSYYWQTTFMYLVGSCQSYLCPVTFPSKTLLQILFNPAGTPVPTSTDVTNPDDVPALGLWPGYLFGPGGAIAPTSDPVEICYLTNSVPPVAGGCPPGDQSAPGDEAVVGAPAPSDGSSRPAPAGSRNSSQVGADRLAATGPAMAPSLLINIGVLAIAVGLAVNLTTFVRRRRPGR